MSSLAVECCAEEFRQSKARRYRTISHHSFVDESLFGNPKHQQVKQVKQKKNVCLTQKLPVRNKGTTSERHAQEVCTDRKNGQGKKQKELQTVMRKDLIKKSVVSPAYPFTESIILPRQQFFRILQASGHPCEEE